MFLYRYVFALFFVFFVFRAFRRRLGGNFSLFFPNKWYLKCCVVVLSWFSCFCCVVVHISCFRFSCFVFRVLCFYVSRVLCFSKVFRPSATTNGCNEGREPSDEW